MIDLGEFKPLDVLAPIRERDGNVRIGRQTSTSEQHTEAVGWLRDHIVDAGHTEGKARIIWSRGEPTVLEIRVRFEHVTLEDEEGKEVKVPVTVVDHELQYTLTGATIHQTRTQLSQQLVDEVTEMARQGQFS